MKSKMLKKSSFAILDFADDATFAVLTCTLTMRDPEAMTRQTRRNFTSRMHTL